jgi:polyferredoxin
MSKSVNFKLSEGKRFNLYKEMLKADPRIMKQEHHIVKILLNVFISNFTMVMLYKLYYHHYDSKLTFLNNFLKPKFLALTTFTFGLNLFLIYLNYNYLPRVIYNEFYSKEIIPDIDFLDLYDHIVTKKKLIK